MSDCLYYIRVGAALVYLSGTPSDSTKGWSASVGACRRAVGFGCMGRSYVWRLPVHGRFG